MSFLRKRVNMIRKKVLFSIGGLFVFFLFLIFLFFGKIIHFYAQQQIEDTLNAPVEISKVSVSGNKIISSTDILSKFDMRKGDRYNPSKINENGILIENEYLENGKLFLEMDIVDIISDSVEIQIKISEGKFVTINNTIFEDLGKSSYRHQILREKLPM